MKDWILYRVGEAKDAALKAWLFLKHRPLLTCPFCKGKGGEVSGYYEPEWSECSTCWHHWEALDDAGMRWPVGRVPLWVYVRSRVSIRFGLWYAAHVRDVIRCKLGRHRWFNEPEHGMRICGTCYEHEALPGPDSTLERISKETEGTGLHPTASDGSASGADRVNTAPTDPAVFVNIESSGTSTADAKGSGAHDLDAKTGGKCGGPDSILDSNSTSPRTPSPSTPGSEVGRG